MIDTTAPIRQSLPRAGGFRFLARIKPPRVALNVLLIVVACLWLMPTITLAIISFRPESLYESSGWWKVLAAPSQLTFSNYSQLFSQGFAAGGLLDSLVTSLEITLPARVINPATPLATERRSAIAKPEPQCMLAFVMFRFIRPIISTSRARGSVDSGAHSPMFNIRF